MAVTLIMKMKKNLNKAVFGYSLLLLLMLRFQIIGDVYMGH